MPTRVLGKLGARQGVIARDLDEHHRLIEALRQSGLGAVKKIARRSNLSQGAIYKYLEDENRSPLELLCRWLDGALEAKPNDRRAALAPLTYLIDRYLTRSDLREVELAALLDVDEAVARFLRDGGGAAQAAIEAMEDREVDDAELGEIRRQVQDTFNALHLLQRLAEAANSRWKERHKAGEPGGHPALDR